MYYAGVDIGGTFTDCVLVDRQGNHWTAKVLSTKDDPGTGRVAGLPIDRVFPERRRAVGSQDCRRPAGRPDIGLFP